MKNKTHIRKILIFFALLSVLSVSARAAAPDSLKRARQLENRLMDAVQAYDDGDFATAKDRLSALVKADQGLDAAWYWLGMTETALGNYDAAVTDLQHAVSLDPRNYWYKDRLSALYDFRGEDDLTVELYESLLEDYPKKTELHFRLLNLYVRRQQFEKALQALQDIENVIGKNERIASTRYDLYRQLGKPEEAVRALQDYNDEFASPSILSMLGDWYMDQFADSTALACYDEAIALQSDFVPAILGRTEVFRLTRRYPEYFDGIRDFAAHPDIPAASKGLYFSNVTRQLDPRFLNQFRTQFDAIIDTCASLHGADSTLLSTAGMYYYATSRKDKAAGLFRENARIHPESLPIEATYVQFLSLAENWPELKAESLEAYRRFPNEPAFLEYNSIANYNLKDYAAVIANAERILSQYPGDSARTVSALSSLGDMHHQLGDEKAAFNAYEKALKINPDYAPVLNNYAYYLSLAGKKLKKAAAMSKKTVDAEPDNPTYLDTYGWILYLQKKYQEAKPLFKHAMLYGGKDNATILDHYAEVLFALKEYDLAQVYWNQAKAKNNGDIPDLEERIAARLASIGK